MIRLATITGLLVLLAGCVEASFDPASSTADALPDFTGSYDMAVGEVFEDGVNPPQGGAVATLTRDGNHYILRVTEPNRSGPAPKDEALYVAGTLDQLVLVYSNRPGAERGAALTGRVKADGSIEVLMTTGGRGATTADVVAALARHGYTVKEGTYTLELSGPAQLPSLGAALWDPAVVAAYAPKVVFRLTPVPD